jgi:hypothetical protein
MNAEQHITGIVNKAIEKIQLQGGDVDGRKIAKNIRP